MEADKITVAEAMTMLNCETTRIRAAMRRVALRFRQQNVGKLSRAELERVEKYLRDETELAIQEMRQTFQNFIERAK